MGGWRHAHVLALVLSVVLIFLGAAFLAANRIVLAGHGMNHNEHASGIPYLPGAAQLSKNYTFYVTQFQTAISRWNNSSTDRDYILETTNASQMKQYMVYSASQQDTDLASFFGTNSCKWWTDNYSSIRNVRAFEYGHSNSNNDRLFTVVCLNVSTLGYPVAFDCTCVTDETRKKGISHEMGHSLHLKHDTGNIMDTCWCYNISTHDGDSIDWIYASPP